VSQDEARKPNVLLSRMQFPTEYGLFIAANLLDVLLTMLFIRYGAGEGNPAAKWIVLQFGKIGFVAFKLVLMFVVIILAEAVARKRRNLARLLIWFGILAMWAVAISSGVRFYHYMQTPGPDRVWSPSPAGRADSMAPAQRMRTEPEASPGRTDREPTTLKLRGVTVPLRLRGVISAPEGTSVLIDVGGELFAGTAGAGLCLRPFEETCKIASVDLDQRIVVIERPGYGEDNLRISLPFPDGLQPSWQIPHAGLTASLEPVKQEYEYASSVMVRVGLRNTTDHEVTIEAGWRGKPHFWFFTSSAREGPVRIPPGLVDSRVLEFDYGKGPVNPTRLPPGGTLTLELDLNKFLEYNTGTPDLVASLPLAWRPGSYRVVGLYQMLKPQEPGIWHGSVTSNLILFTVLPRVQK